MELNNQNPKEQLFQQTYLKALLDNKNSTAQWTSYKEKYEDVIKHLQFYTEKSKHSVCIPIGGKAFMRGQLVHTNDVWVTLGCGWFLKTSSKKAVEICERRLKTANELLEKWERENKLLESMRNYSIKREVFPNSDCQEIVEAYDDKKEEKWKEEHREKEKNYRLQLKELRSKTESPVLKEENDLWEHLEALELQEELEDELNRLGCNDSSSEDYFSGSEDSMQESDDETSMMKNSDKPHVTEILTDKAVEIEPKPIVHEVLKHQDYENSKSTKKKVSFSDHPEIQETTREDTEIIEIDNVTTDAVLDQVIERVPNINNFKTEQKRPISQFKMNRKK